MARFSPPARYDHGMDTPPPPKRSPYSFTLRKALLSFVVFGVLMAGARWWYIRIYTQAWALEALQRFDVRVEYDDSYLPSNRQNWAGYGPGHFGPPHRNPLDIFGRNAGHAIIGVNVPVPLRSLEDAKEVNRILRHLPHLADVHIRTSDFGQRDPEFERIADEHLEAAIDGLPLAGIMLNTYGFMPDRTIAALAQRKRNGVATICWESGSPPTLETLQLLCAVPSLRRLSFQPELTGGHFRILAGANQLTWLYVNASSTDGLLHLRKLKGCEVAFRSVNLTDADLRDVVSKLPNLGSLGLQWSKVTDDGVRSLAACTSLKSLSLQAVGGITDVGILPLSALPHLETVNLMGTAVSEEGVIELCRKCPVKKVIAPSHHDWLRLKTALPDVDIQVPTATGRSNSPAASSSSSPKASLEDADQEDPAEE